MSYRTDDLTATFMRWLDRYSPPNRIAAQPKLVQDEREALLKVVLRRAPHSEWADWLAAVIEDAERAMTTRAWPSVADLHRAADHHKVAVSGDPMVGLDEYQLTAARIGRHEAIGEFYLWGPKAKELVARGLVTEGDLEPYRDGQFWAGVDVYGFDRAKAMQSERRRFHAAAQRPVSDEARNRERDERRREIGAQMRRMSPSGEEG